MGIAVKISQEVRLVYQHVTKNSQSCTALSAIPTYLCQKPSPAPAYVAKISVILSEFFYSDLAYHNQMNYTLMWYY